MKYFHLFCKFFSPYVYSVHNLILVLFVVQPTILQGTGLTQNIKHMPSTTSIVFPLEFLAKQCLNQELNVLLWQYNWKAIWNPVKHLMMMKMMNCFCDMVHQRKAFSLISSQDYCQRSSPSWISDVPWAGFKPAQFRLY